MIPRIRETSPVQSIYLQFLETLKNQGFAGDLNPDYANRTVLSTDNSIYQVLPQGVVYPRNIDDLVLIAQLSQRDEFRQVALSPRGGGTGTNGQSLTDGLVVDISRHMNQILEINEEERWVRVETGVVKDQLNAALKPYGLFFAPELSTSNRATIGGMINTDASGQGSCLYGKTRDHVLSLKTVLLDGRVCDSAPLDDTALATARQNPGRIGAVVSAVDDIERSQRDLIAAKFPKLNRCLTGYDLAHVRTPTGEFDLNSVLCGSEGTLGFIAEAKLNVLPIPKCAALVNVNYRDFNAALRDATELMQALPTSIETVDSKVLNLAMNDIVWHSVSEFFPPVAGEDIKGINLVEYTADSQQELDAGIKRLTSMLDAMSEADKTNTGRIGYTIAMGSESVNKIWGMRKKAVGLLGNAAGEARPIPFVEDTAVPPENLADFIFEFRELLDSHNLAYGMFGHVDAGVLHVRPAIDMKDPEQEKLIREISDKVVALTQKYNGLLWGEHGKGVRSEYAPQFFGELYPEIQKVKAAFDPFNQLNPGKIATPNNDSELLSIDGVVTRGQQDRKIPVQVWEGYSEGMHCNGNGLCYNWNPNDAMCPSWKATRERVHSPKGRSSLMREWLKQLSERQVNAVELTQQVRSRPFIFSLPSRIAHSIGKKQGKYDFSHEVNNAMQGCLACKSCVGQCPIKVDVPEFRAKFLELYYSRYLRPLKDYFVGSLEYLMPTLARVPWLYNGLMKPVFMQKILAKVAGMVDSPLLTGVNLDRALQAASVRYATPQNIATLNEETKAKTVILVQDAFTSYFETQLVLDSLKLLKILGFNPMLAPFKPNGKPLHVHGFLKAFRKAANNNADMLNVLTKTNIPLVGIEPSMTLAYRSEYQKVLGDKAPEVALVQEWLAQQNLTPYSPEFGKSHYILLAHCTEKTNAAASVTDWQTVYQALGQELALKDTGCCGMAGTYGHEAANVETSKTIYSQSWQSIVENPELDGKLTATGYSCRSQAKRLSDVRLPHPLQVLLAAYQG
ncbi:FAD-binding and (Fe-S)-binding domain-containing protein [Gilvimarinus sp. SDUM040013]|uniref:FAD-binding and (Fe-S)-binding domain-containing protein n=1 Tax=Gilvimarinus gilvus TaxID=3058038 RepID=A0ABU4RTG0_9GAMM|nr:FAD-binding and (Fe-S)-binding domain-containing protein [Gilvimarinus sp. SDUM040013]MDO3386932.1 FAD-binding and (Fe-S)-binding domain-containing protein [Gilvimarinus sp. SDUM040013]MDX6848174.1 FAD-binding and (Fe-S)-binding domain-containing protein [Gilvimarinus sp. SDUM040013]